MNVVMNLQIPLNAGNVACFLPGRARDLSAPCIMPDHLEDRLYYSLLLEKCLLLRMLFHPNEI